MSKISTGGSASASTSSLNNNGMPLPSPSLSFGGASASGSGVTPAYALQKEVAAIATTMVHPHRGIQTDIASQLSIPWLLNRILKLRMN
jgi:hypothetical protein